MLRVKASDGFATNDGFAKEGDVLNSPRTELVVLPEGILGM